MEILNKKNVEFKTIEYLKTGFLKEELIKISKKLNLRPKDFIRRKDQNVENLELENDSKVFNAIIKCPKIIERPIIINKEKAIIGRPPELLYDFL